MAAGRALLSLAGRLAVVTGAGRGIGRETALALAREGADLALVARTEPELAAVTRLVAEHGRTALPVAADLSTPAGVDRIIGALHDRRVDVLVNNAGAAGPFGPAWELDVDAWERLLHLNLTAVFRLSAAFVPRMIAAGRGRIVNITSSASLQPLERTGVYSVAKAGVNMLTRQLAAELREHDGVSVVCFAPGPSDTAAYGELAAQPVERIGRQGFERFARTVRDGRLAPPGRAAQVIAAMACEPTAALSGSYVDIGDDYCSRALARVAQ